MNPNDALGCILLVLFPKNEQVYLILRLALKLVNKKGITCIMNQLEIINRNKTCIDSQPRLLPKYEIS